MTLWQSIVGFNDRFFTWWRERTLLYWSNALAGEVGEICGKVKRLIGGGTNKYPVTAEDIVEECVDTYIYMVLLCECLGIHEHDFMRIAENKLVVLAQRMTAETLREAKRE